MPYHPTQADLTKPTNSMYLTVTDAVDILHWRNYIPCHIPTWPHLRLHNPRTGTTLLYRTQDVTTQQLLTAHSRGWFVFLCHQEYLHIGRSAPVILGAAYSLVPADKVHEADEALAELPADHLEQFLKVAL